MCIQLLSLIYRLEFNRGGRRLPRIEECLGFELGRNLSEDDKRNELASFENLFSSACRPFVEQLCSDLFGEMRGVPYGQCAEIIESLMFLQELTSTALWKYHQNVGEKLESFAREWDRLDVLAERVRLHEHVQAQAR